MQKFLLFSRKIKKVIKMQPFGEWIIEGFLKRAFKCHKFKISSFSIFRLKSFRPKLDTLETLDTWTLGPKVFVTSDLAKKSARPENTR